MIGHVVPTPASSERGPGLRAAGAGPTRMRSYAGAVVDDGAASAHGKEQARALLARGGASAAVQRSASGSRPSARGVDKIFSLT